jgi:ubiquitin-conjugating enzyme E2 J1
MDTDAGGQVGGMSAPDNVRKALAEKSRGYSCAGCGKAFLTLSGALIPDEEENPLVGKIGLIEPKKDGNAAQASATPTESSQSEDVVAGSEPELPTVAADREVQPAHTPQQPQPQSQTPAVPRAQTQPQPQPQPPAQLQQPPLQPVVATTTTDAWIDKAIIGIVIALVLMILRRAA